MKKLFLFLTGVILGIVLTIGGTVGVGYYFLTNKTLGDVGDLLNASDTIAPTDKDKETKIIDFILGTVACLRELDKITIEQFEETIGTTALSVLLNEKLGIQYSDIAETKVVELPKAIAESLTIGKVSEMFGVGLPDFPLFESEEFLNSPITEAFESLSDQRLDAFISIIYDNDPKGREASSPMLQKLGVLKLSALSEDMDGVINDMLLSDIITDAPADSMISHFLHLKVGELGTEADGVINSLKLNQLMKIDPQTSPKLFITLQECSLVTVYETDEDGNLIYDGNGEKIVKTLGIQEAVNTLPLKDLVDVGDAPIWTKLGEATLDNLGSVVDDLKINDVMEITDDTHIIVKRLAERDTPVTEIGTALGDVLEITTIGELLGIDETNKDENEPILVALMDTPLEKDALNQTLEGLTVASIFKDYDSGMLSLVSPNTKLNELPLELSKAVAETNIYKLDNLGVYKPDFTSATHKAKGYVYNLSIVDMTNDFVSTLSNPLASTLPKTVNLTGDVLTNEIVSDLITANGKGITIRLTEDTTIEMDTTFTQLFNIDCDGHELIIEENVSVILPDGGSGYMYIEGYQGDWTSTNHPIIVEKFKVSGSGTSTVYVDSVMIEYFPNRDPDSPAIPLATP